MALGFVVDNSVVMAWCFDDEASTYAADVLKSLDRSEAAVPAIWPLAVGNVLAVAERQRRLTNADSIRFLALLKSLPIQVHQESPDRMLGEVFALAREHGLSTYDASYLDLAVKLALPIATIDASLAHAADKCHVSVFQPGETNS